MGSIWKARSERSGNDYLSVAFSSPTGTLHRASGLRREDDPSGTYEIVAFAGSELAAVA